MKIVEEFSAEFQIEFVAEIVDAFQNFPGLHFEVFFRVESDSFHW